MLLGRRSNLALKGLKLQPAAPSPGDKVGGNTVQVPSPVTSEFMRCWTLRIKE
jgi:hypothetical protein